MKTNNIEKTVLCSIAYDGIVEALHYLAIDDFVYYQDIFIELLRLNRQGKPLHSDFVREDLQEKFLDVEMATPVTNWKTYADQLKAEGSKRAIKLKLAKAQTLLDEDDTDEAKSLIASCLINNSRRINIVNFNTVEASDTELICQDFMPLPRGSVTIISAAGSTGKTWIALHLQNVAAQRNLRSFGWYSEDSAGVLKNRLNAVNKMRYSSKNDLLDVCDDSPIPICRRNKDGLFYTDKCYELQMMMSKYDLVVIDPLVNFIGSARENENDDMTFFMQPFIRTAKINNISIVFLHHSRKNSEDGQNKVRGAGAITNAARTAYEVEKIYKQKKLDETKKSQRVIRLTKDNLGAYRQFGGFERELTITPDTDFIAKSTNDDAKIEFAHMAI